MPLAGGHRTALLVPLRTHDALVGHLCLGPKRWGEPFSAEDRALLATLGGHLAAVVRNAGLVQDLRAQVAAVAAQKEALDALNERLERAHEEERAQLSADVHDEPLQTALQLRRRLAMDCDGRATTDGRLVALGDALVAQLHALCTRVRPRALDELGLAAAIEVLALELVERADEDVLVRLDVDAALSSPRLPATVDVALYRAAQEALNNSLRHGRPRIVDVALRRRADRVQLRVCDDGAGFPVPAELADLGVAGHLGLAGLQRRAGHLGGSMEVTSAPGKGTVVQVELPIGGPLP